MVSKDLLQTKASSINFNKQKQHRSRASKSEDRRRRVERIGRKKGPLIVLGPVVIMIKT
ncbi:hypothetical protein A2U01_0093932, partial [Trifolium medium]|nr:hypothetical protein [Trifolium medium]